MNNSYGLGKVFFRVAVSFFLVFAGTTAVFAQGDARVLKDIVFEETGNGFSVSILTDRAIPEYNPSCLLYPSRFVVDLPGNWNNAGKSMYEVSNSTVEKIVVGEHEDYLRIVVHLFGGIRLSPVIEESEKGIVLKVSERMIETVDGYVEADLAGKRTISEIEYNDTPTEFTITLVSDEPISEFKSFFVSDESPSALIIDLPGFWDFPGEPEISVASDMVRLIRIGEHPDFFRLAIDLAVAEPLSPEFAELPNGMLITIKK